MNEFTDESTVFSICPYEVHEFKPGLYPGHFIIPACEDENNPNRKVIGISEHYMNIGGKEKPIAVTTSSRPIAKAIVDDFLDGLLFTTPEAHPGICWLPDNVTVETFKIKHIDMHKSMKIAQRKWCILLVEKTESEWKKNKNPRIVSDPARFAVRFLGIPTPEWMQVQEIGENYTACPACNTQNNPNNAICTNCHCVLDIEKHKKLIFA